MSPWDCNRNMPATSQAHEYKLYIKTGPCPRIYKTSCLSQSLCHCLPVCPCSETADRLCACVCVSPQRPLCVCVCVRPCPQWPTRAERGLSPLLSCLTLTVSQHHCQSHWLGTSSLRTDRCTKDDRGRIFVHDLDPKYALPRSVLLLAVASVSPPRLLTSAGPSDYSTFRVDFCAQRLSLQLSISRALFHPALRMLSTFNWLLSDFLFSCKQSSKVGIWIWVKIENQLTH